MHLADLVSASARVAATRARLEKTRILAELLRAAPPHEVALAVTWLSGNLRQRKTGVGYATVQKLWSTPAAETSSLDLATIDARLEEASKLSGSGSSGRREQLLGELFSRATKDEQQFLGMLIVGELRQGSLEGQMAEAIAAAFNVSADAVRRAGMMTGDLAPVAAAAQAEGAAGLARFKLQLFRPLQPMLAGTAETVEDALRDLGEAALEHKLDGARIQVHRDGDEIRVYSREGNEVTGAVPEVVSMVRAMPGHTLVLDGEAVALRPEGRPHPFQITMRRFGRRHDLPKAIDELPLSPFFFDILHLDGDDILDRPWTERTKALDERLPAPARVERIVTAKPEDAAAFYAQALARGQEGLLAKHPASAYEAGRRGSAWLKLKPAQTLDLVVLAVEWGSGRRKGWLSNLHLGARDPKTGGFVMLGKTFKGMTDAMLKWQTEKLLSLELSRDAHVVYVKPELVAEIAFDSVQESPHYPGGMALRFARVKRYREDKPAPEADTIDAVRAVFARTHSGSAPHSSE
jgi:DNA ligase 1